MIHKKLENGQNKIRGHNQTATDNNEYWSIYKASQTFQISGFQWVNLFSPFDRAEQGIYKNQEPFGNIKP